jgi:hypothetical protein
MKLSLGLALAFAFVVAPSLAADSNGKFMMKGIGAKTCQDLLRGNGVTNEQLDVFLDGFVTSLNIERADTYDIVPGAEWPKVMEGMTAYCGNNREEPLAIAAWRMIEYYFPRRIKQSPNK